MGIRAVGYASAAFLLLGAACAATGSRTGNGSDDDVGVDGGGSFSGGGSGAGSTASAVGGAETGGATSYAGTGGATIGSGGARAAGGAASTGGASGEPDAGSVLPSGEQVTPESGYLHTRGSVIVDSNEHEVRLTGLSWFGMETSNYAPHGLWSRSLASMLDQMKQLGYNSVRLPFCSELFDAGSTANGVDANQNPDLVGVNGLALMDKVVEAAGARGLKVILDRHRPDSGGQSALWYTDAYPEARWIDDWKMLATHYLGNETVVGFDLHNEPHDPATWGDGSPTTDWRAAAERAGNAALDVNPQLLIIVEGVQTFGGHGYWWGGNLRGAAAYPVHLSVANRLVYSVHDYPASVADQPWFHDPTYPSNLPALWHDTWGYLVNGNVAPVWIGEFGTKLATDSDKQWLGALASTITTNRLNFAYWCWNPNSGDTGGILEDDWTTVNQPKQSVLQPLLAPPIP